MVSRKENKVKRIVLLFISIWIAFAAYGEDNHKKERHPDDRKINVGIRGGFNSSMFLVSDLKIKDVTIDEIQNNYKIGYFGALFMRLNMKRHFIQPEISYNISRCEGEMAGSVLQSANEYASKSLDICQQYFDGKIDMKSTTEQPHITITPVLITSDNVDEYIEMYTEAGVMK